MTIQKAALLALLFFLSGVSFAADCYLVNGQHVCVNRVGIPPITTLGDIARQQQPADTETVRIFGIYKNSADKLSAPERASLKATLTGLPEQQLSGLLTTLAALSEDDRINVLKVLANMTEQDRGKFYAELFK